MDLHNALSQSYDHTAKLIGGVQPGQLDGPTPCTEWQLRQVLSHAMGVIANMTRGARGEELLAEMNSYPLEDDLASQFRSETERNLAAWKANGPSGEVNVGAGPMPAEFAMGINLVDITTHSWDIACATGQDGTLSDELATTVLSVAKGFVNDDIRKFVGIDPPIPVGDDANPTVQLVAFMGRQP